MGNKGSKYITFITALIENITPLHIGTGDGEILIDKIEQKAYMPATGIAGAFKEYITNTEGLEEAKKIFGYNDNESKVFVFDSFTSLKSNKEIEKRPGLRINEITGSNKNGAKLNRVYLAAGHTFEIKFKLFSQEENNRNNNLAVMYKCIKALDEKKINFGAYKTSGGGQFKVIKVEQLDESLTSIDTIMSHLKRDKSNSKDITKKIKDISIEDSFAEFYLEGEIDTPLLIKGQNSNDSNRPDSENIKNAKGDYIIPGSSFKGVLRGYCRKALDYLNKGKYIEYMFGNEAESMNDREMGRVFTKDIIITSAKDDKIYHRIKINKFTGGVLNGALIKEKPILGDVSIDVKYKITNDETKDTVAIAMLCLAFRDLGLGKIPLGSGNNIGRGRIKGKKARFVLKGNEVTIDFENKSIINKDYLDKLMNGLN